MIYSRAIQHLPQARQRRSRISRAVISAGVASIVGASLFKRLCTSLRQALVRPAGTGNGNGATDSDMPKLRRAMVSKTLKAPREIHHLIIPLARAA